MAALNWSSLGKAKLCRFRGFETEMYKDERKHHAYTYCLKKQRHVFILVLKNWSSRAAPAYLTRKKISRPKLEQVVVKVCFYRAAGGRAGLMQNGNAKWGSCTSDEQEEDEKDCRGMLDIPRLVFPRLSSQVCLRDGSFVNERMGGCLTSLRRDTHRSLSMSQNWF